MFDRAEIRRLYQSGLSSRQVAEKVGCSGHYAWAVCKDIARDQYNAAKLRQPPTKFYWRACHQAARNLMARVLGRKLKRSEHVHHKNGDRTDNRLENLELMDQAAHQRHHTALRFDQSPEAKEARVRSKRDYNVKYLRAYYKWRRGCASSTKTIRELCGL